VALAVPLFVALLLCLHLYNIKVERAIEKRHGDFANVSAQIEHTMAGVNNLFTAMFNLYQQPKPHLADSTMPRTEEHTSELQSPDKLVCHLQLEKKKKKNKKQEKKKKKKKKITTK